VDTPRTTLPPRHAVTASRAARPLRFGVVGAITFALQIALLALFIDAGTGSVAAYAIALAVCVQFNFVVNQLLVWHDRPLSRAPRRVVHRWATFHACIALSLAVNLAAFVVAEAFMPYLAAAVVALGASTVIKFLSLDRLVFRPARVL